MITIDDANFRLIEFRTKHGITQKKLSELTGVSRPTIIDIEKNRKRPHAETIHKLNQYIGLFTDGN